jgi:hypothetical protein
MSNLSELLPTGGGQNAVDFVATGTLASGQTVALKTDGTVEAVAASASSVGSAVVWNSGASLYISSCFDSNLNKVVVAYQDQGDSNKGKAIVGTVSGSSISFGSPVIFSQAQARYQSAVFDSNANKVVIAYQNQDNTYGQAVVGTVSGTSISFGSEVTFESASSRYVNAAFDSTVNKVIISYRDDGNSSYGTAIVGTVSGTSISYGTAVVYNSGECQPQDTVYDSNANKTVILYTDTANSYRGTAIIGTVSGTNISFGTEVVFNAANTFYTAGIYDSVNQKVIALYSDGGDSDKGKAVIGTVSGTSISFSSAITFSTSGITETSAAYSAASSSVIVSYRIAPQGYGTVISGAISASNIVFDSAVTFTTDNTGYTASVYDSNAAKYAISFQDKDNSNQGESLVFTDASSNNTSFIGIASEAISNTATGAINVYGGIAASASATLPAVLSAGTAAVFEAATTNYISSAFDANSNKVVISYRDGGDADKGTAIVGTVSGTTISFGTPVVYSTDTSVNSTVFDSNSNKIVIAYRHNGNSNYGTAIVGTVSGTSISFGTPVVFETADSGSISATFDSNANKVVISYDDNGNSSYGTAIVGTVSGTSISFGTPVVFISSLVEGTSSAYDSTNNKTAIAFINASGHLGAIVATLSGTSLTFGSVATNSLASEFPCAVFDPVNNKIVIAYKQSVGTASVCTISGTSISLGTPVVFNNSNTQQLSGAYNVDKSNIVFVGYQSGATGIAVVGTVSGTSISFGSVITFESGEIGFTSSVYDSVAKKTLAAYQDTANSYYGTATVFTQSAGVLTIASDYYVQSDGTLTTASASPAVKVGQAISATTINMKDLT